MEKSAGGERERERESKTSGQLVVCQLQEPRSGESMVGCNRRVGKECVQRYN